MSTIELKVKPQRFYVLGDTAILEVAEKKLFGSGKTYKICMNDLIAKSGLRVNQLTPQFLKDVVEGIPKKINVLVTNDQATIVEQIAFRRVLVALAEYHGNKKPARNIEDL